MTLPKAPGLRLESLAIEIKTISSTSPAPARRLHVRSADAKAVGCTAITDAPFPI